MGDHQLLEGAPGGERQRAGAQPADGAGRHLDHRGPPVVHAHLGVDGPVDQAEGARWRPRRRPSRRRRSPGRGATGSRRCVSSKAGPSSGSGLSKTARTSQLARRRAGPRRPPRGRGRTRSTSSGAPGSTPAAVAMRRTRAATATASSAVSARSTPWLPDSVVRLDHAREPDAPVTPRPPRRGRRRRRRGAKAGWGTSAAASRVRMTSLSRAAATASGGLWRRPRRGRGLGRDHRAHVVDGDHGVEGGDGVVGHDGAAAASGVVEGDLERTRAHDASQGVGLRRCRPPPRPPGPGPRRGSPRAR